MLHYAFFLRAPLEMPIDITAKEHWVVQAAYNSLSVAW